MAGQLHPLIIRLFLETVWMAGHFMSFDAYCAEHEPLQSERPSSAPLGRVNVEEYGLQRTVIFPDRESTRGKADEDMVH